MKGIPKLTSLKNVSQQRNGEMGLFPEEDSGLRDFVSEDGSDYSVFDADLNSKEELTKQEREGELLACD